MMDKCIMTAAWWSTQTAQCRQIPLDFKYDNIKLREGKIQINSKHLYIESWITIKGE